MKKVLTIIILVIIISPLFTSPCKAVAKMPFYGLNGENMVLRAQFSTDYSKSSTERKHNIALAAKSLNNAFIDVAEEFSFNDRVGKRTVANGYQSAKIIVNGEFTEGVGGGVCQVSTTLYNAALLADLKINEKHAHSLAVSYVEPSFDAMVNSGSADLKIVNNTKNPIIIKTSANGNTLTVKILGNKLAEKITRKSVVKELIPAPIEYVKDEELSYPDLLEGEEKTVSNGKSGLISIGYLIKEHDGKTTTKQIRTDRYSPIKKIVVLGTAKKELQGKTYSPPQNELFLSISR